MLFPGFIGSLIFDLTKKLRKDGTRLGSTYFLLNIGLFTLFTLAIGSLIALFSSGQGPVPGKFYLWLVMAGVLLGAIHAIVTWLIWFRKEK